MRVLSLAALVPSCSLLAMGPPYLLDPSLQKIQKQVDLLKYIRIFYFYLHTPPHRTKTETSSETKITST